jgi:hypothetical protein
VPYIFSYHAITMTIFFSILLLLASLLIFAVGGMASDFHKSDAAGNAMTQGFAFLLAIVLWLMLGALLLISGARNKVPVVSTLVTLVLYVGAIAGYVVALNILKELASGDRFESLLRIVVMTCPWAVVFYCLWNFFPGVRSVVPTAAANCIAAVPLLVLAVVPWLAKGPTNAMMAARRQAYQDAYDQQQKLIQTINALPADTPLTAFLGYTEAPSSDASGAAISRMRTLPKRQSEAEELLRKQDLRLLRVLADLDVTMSPALCEGGRQSIRKLAEQFKPATPAPPFASVEDKLNMYTTSMRWLRDNGCDCKEEIRAFEQTVRLYPESYPRKWLTDYLLELQGKPREP